MRLSNIASLPTNIPRLPTVILRNDNGTKIFRDAGGGSIPRDGGLRVGHPSCH
jgi:hypothetical protein